MIAGVDQGGAGGKGGVTFVEHHFESEGRELESLRASRYLARGRALATPELNGALSPRGRSELSHRFSALVDTALGCASNVPGWAMLRRECRDFRSTSDWE